MNITQLIKQADENKGVMAVLNAPSPATDTAIAAVEDKFLSRIRAPLFSFDGLVSDQKNQMDALKSSGIKTVLLEVNKDKGDGVFIQDSLWVAKNLKGPGFILFVLNPGDPSRNKELPELIETLKPYVEEVVPWEGVGNLEGGDLLHSILNEDGTATVVGGLRTDAPSQGNVRSNSEGFRSFEKMIKPFGYKLGLFEFKACLHATSGMSMSLDNNGTPVVVSDEKHLKDKGIQELKDLGVKVILSDFGDHRWFGVNAPYVGGKRIVSNLPEIVKFYEENDMAVHATFTAMYHMAWLQGSGTCLLQLFCYPLVTKELRDKVDANS